MKTIIALACALAFLATGVNAETRLLTVLGDMKVKTSWRGGMPKASKVAGITTDVTGLMFANGRIVPTFGFESRSRKTIVRVVVEDVTGSEPVRLVSDLEPQLTEGRWKGDAAPLDVAPEATPWLFEPGDTMKVYCFTVEFSGGRKPIMIYQPAIFPADAKQLLVSLAGMTKTAGSPTAPAAAAPSL